MIGISEFIPLVYLKAKEGKLAWDQAGESGFISPIGDGVVNIRRELKRTSYGVNVIAYRFSLANSSGTTLETYQAIDTEDYFSDLEDIYEMARRKALKVDETLSDLMKSLKSL